MCAPCRSARRSSQNEEEGPSNSNTPLAGAHNFYSVEGLGGLGMAGPSVLTAQPAGPLSAKRAREWEGGGLGRTAAPLLKDTLAELGQGEEGEEGGAAGMDYQPHPGGEQELPQQPNYF